MCPCDIFLPGLSVRYPGRTANDPSFAHGHDARSGRENARSARQRNDIPVQTIPRLPWRMTRRPEPAVVTGRDTRGRPWWKAWIWSVLSSAMAIRGAPEASAVPAVPPRAPLVRQTGCAQWPLPCLPQGEVQKDLAVTGSPACGPSVNNAASGNERCREVRRRDGGKRSALALSLFPDRLSRAGGWHLRPRPAFFL